MKQGAVVERACGRDGSGSEFVPILFEVANHHTDADGVPQFEQSLGRSYARFRMMTPRQTVENSAQERCEFLAFTSPQGASGMNPHRHLGAQFFLLQELLRARLEAPSRPSAVGPPAKASSRLDAESVHDRLDPGSQHGPRCVLGNRPDNPDRLPSDDNDAAGISRTA